MLFNDSCTLYGSRRFVIKSQQVQRTLLAIFFAVMLSLMLAPHSGSGRGLFRFWGYARGPFFIMPSYIDGKQLALQTIFLATGLMVLLVVGTAIDLPLLLPRVITGVEINAWKIEQSLFLVMLLPLFIGLVVHAKFRSLPAWLCSSMGLVANVSALVVLVLIVAFNFQSVVRLFGTEVIFAGFIFVLLSVLIGWLFGGHDREIRCALGLGTGLRDVGAALFIGTKNFDDARVNVMVIVTALLGLFILLPAASAFGRRTRIATSSRLDSRTSPPRNPKRTRSPNSIRLS